MVDQSHEPSQVGQLTISHPGAMNHSANHSGSHVGAMLNGSRISRHPAFALNPVGEPATTIKGKARPGRTGQIMGSTRDSPSLVPYGEWVHGG